MTMCMPYMRGPTPLSRYARSLGVQEAAVEAQPLLLFPMYTVPLEALMQMSQVVPHEELKEKGILVEFDPSMGHAAFVSHQWVDSQHPDPEFKQMRVLQDALKHAMSSVEISLDVVTATVMPSAKSLPTSKLCSQPLFLWYDYFSCPQLENQAGGESRPCLSKAIDSIPAYITKCSFFFALCPVLENPSGSRLLTPATWAERGWCRVERAVHELGPCESWILIRSSIELELVVIPAVSPVGCLGGRPPAEGQFSVASDRRKLQPLLEEALKRKLLLLLKAQDFVNYRLLLNLQGIHLRGFPFPRHLEPIPGFQAEDHANVPDRSASVLVAQFLYQNGFSSVNETDQAGWSPLHYGALRGDVSLIQGLLMKRADPNRLTKQDQPSVGLPPFSSALTISVCFKHNAAARVLISAKAQIEGGLLKPMEFAAAGDNPEGVQLLHEAGGQLHVRSVMGFTALEIASCRGAASAMLEIVRLAKVLCGALWL
ncbi:unnamed protein product [Durusdinium trenchii]|uniref:Uncharacterized protein n=1 Tax=Durusdinium trenchii TaxID=1381693 RepID=A0ABP0MZY2_9DINO